MREDDDVTDGTEEKTPTDDRAGAYSLAWFYDSFADACTAVGERARAISVGLRANGLPSTRGGREDFHTMARMICRWALELLDPD
jgi:hypothetical protein